MRNNNWTPISHKGRRKLLSINISHYSPITSQSLDSLSVSLRVCCMGTSGSRLTGFCGDRMPPSGGVGTFPTCQCTPHPHRGKTSKHKQLQCAKRQGLAECVYESKEVHTPGCSAVTEVLKHTSLFEKSVLRIIPVHKGKLRIISKHTDHF